MDPPVLAHYLFGEDLSLLRGTLTLQADEVLSHWESESARTALRDAEVIITGWGCPRLDETLLDYAPNLQAILHAGGRASDITTPGLRARGIRLTNAGDANSLPVAEYTLGMILLANKRFFQAVREYRARQERIDREATFPEAGNFRRTVGIVGASRIGRRVMELLAPFDLDIVLYDPYVTAPEAGLMNARKVSLEELMAISDIVSIHAPLLPSTEGLISAELLGGMKPGATLINTARGELIDQDALLDVLQANRISAVLDVSTPDPLPPAHPLYELPNVLLTPHIAGSVSGELGRMGEHLVEELKRFARGERFAAEELL
ncbi:hydroxyacid dehydrogenase [Arthrobacter sp. JZ12]|nr:hydroxyacid dehydrogenase [Arthrobacter sp. JZ12]